MKEIPRLRSGFRLAAPFLACPEVQAEGPPERLKFPLKIQTGALSPPGWPPASADSPRSMTCYTSPFPPMLKTTIKPGICMSLLLIFLAGTHGQQPAPSLGESASEFAQEILSRGLPNAISVTFESLVNLPADESHADRVWQPARKNFLRE